MTPTPFLTLPDERGYGFLKMNVDGKPLEITVTNHIKDPNEVCNFRVIYKTKNGFITATNWSCFVKTIFYFPIGKIISIQLETLNLKNEKVYYDVFLTKNNKWYSIDIGFLKSMQLGILKKRFPKMVDPTIINSVGAESSQDLVFFKKEILPVQTEPVSL